MIETTTLSQVIQRNSDMPGIGVQDNVFMASDKSYCGCKLCTQEVWDTVATDSSGSFSCGDRIKWLQNTQEMSYRDACILVSNIEFPNGLCGPYCDPTSCNPDETVSSEAVLKIE